MFNEAEYVEDGERFEMLVLERETCSFEGNLYPRKEGGFDLYLFRDNSEFECLELDKITWLRQQAPDGSLFMERFSEASLDRGLNKRWRRCLCGGSMSTWGFPPGGKYKCRWDRNPA